MNVGFNLEAKKPRKAIATEESRKIGYRKSFRGRCPLAKAFGVSFPEWREAGSLPYSQIVICKIDN
jgi:hypothetical protein